MPVEEEENCLVKMLPSDVCHGAFSPMPVLPPRRFMGMKKLECNVQVEVDNGQVEKIAQPVEELVSCNVGKKLSMTSAEKYCSVSTSEMLCRRESNMQEEEKLLTTAFWCASLVGKTKIELALRSFCSAVPLKYESM